MCACHIEWTVSKRLLGLLLAVSGRACVAVLLAKAGVEGIALCMGCSMQSDGSPTGIMIYILNIPMCRAKARAMPTPALTVQ